MRTLDVADLTGAPRLLRGVIRSGFPKDTTRPVLLDLEGGLGRTMRGDQAALVALAYGADGRLRLAVELPLDDSAVTIRDQLLTAAQRL